MIDTTQAMSCKVDGCNKHILALGYCSRHYTRLRKWGDPVAGIRDKPSRGEVKDYYFNVVLPYDGDKCLLWPFFCDADTYPQVVLDGKKHKVHRLLCTEQYGPHPTNKNEAAHSCGNGAIGCVTKRHLRWASSAENSQDAIAHGTKPKGSRHPQAILAEPDVRKIKLMLKCMTHKEIAQIYGVSKSAISAISCGANWGWLK